MNGKNPYSLCVIKDVYTYNLFETFFMVAKDDLKGNTTHFTGF